MTHMVPRLPGNAPFSAAERAWLDGFLAGFLGQGGTSAPMPDAAMGVAAPSALAPEPEDTPWHDATLPLDERMKLADGRPRAQRLMAAMAQQDCGQCGYLCKTYAEAIATGEEKSLSRCVPGGEETARMLKKLIAEVPATMTVAAAPASAPAGAALPTKAPQGQAQFQGAFRLT